MSDRRGVVREQDSYDVYVGVGVDHLGADDFNSAVAHFMKRTNAVELKRELEARGASVRVEKSIVRLHEAALPAWFSDYEPPPPQSREYAGEDAAEVSKGGRKPVDIEGAPPSWWRRAFGG